MSEKVGVFLPTFNRPDLVRACVLQWMVQSRCPDIIVIHQNGSPESYEWAVADLKELMPIEWLFTPEKLPPVEWYRRPLQRLIELDCTHFFWADHDDLYWRQHIETRLDELDSCDLSLSNRNSILYHRGGEFQFQRRVQFVSHPAGGMSASMAFNRSFAQALHQDFLDHPELEYADCAVSEYTAPRFRRLISNQQTTVYVSHEGSQTSATWLDDILPKPAVKDSVNA